MNKSSEITFSLKDISSVGLGWNSAKSAMPPSIVILEEHPYSLGAICPGKLILMLEIDPELDTAERQSEEYGPQLFLLLNIPKIYQTIKITLSPAFRLGFLRVTTVVDNNELFDDDVSLHHVDDDSPPHTVLLGERPLWKRIIWPFN